MNFIVVEIDPGIELTSGLETRLLAKSGDLSARNAFEPSANRVQGHVIQLLRHFIHFNHSVKMDKMVKLVGDPLQQFAAFAER